MEPKIRFKGFEGEWKTSTIGEIAPLQRGYDLPTNNVISGTIPVVYSNGILRFHNEGKCQAPAIITGRSGTIGKFTYIDHGEYWPHNTSLWVTTFHKNYPRFVYYFFQNVGFEKYATGSGVPTLNRNDIHKHIESIPSNKEEQQAIASYFTTLDSQISASTSRLASLKQMKAASLQAMFPQEGETVPKIRFKGFEGEWKTCPLYHFAKKRIEKNTKMLYNITLTNSAEFGIIDQRNFFDHEISNSENINGYYVVRDHDFVYNPRISSSAPVGPINQNKLGYTGVMSPLYLVFEINGINRDFLEIFFHTTLWHKYMFDNGNTGARFDRLAISDEDFMKMPIPDIDIEEQQAIANYFTSLDRQISLQSQRLEKLKQIKSACLDKMFV